MHDNPDHLMRRIEHARKHGHQVWDLLARLRIARHAQLERELSRRKPRRSASSAQRQMKLVRGKS